MHKGLIFVTLIFLLGSAHAQIDLDYALDDGRLSQKSNILSLSVDDALRGDIGVYYTREFKAMDLSFGYSHRLFDPLKEDFLVLDNFPRTERQSVVSYVQYSLAYDQIIQSIENYGFSLRLHYSQFTNDLDDLHYQSLAVNSGFLFKPVMNNILYFNAFVGLGAVLLESEKADTDLGVYLALECRLGFKFNLVKQ